MISQLDISVNGRSIQNISQYSYIYNIISDWVYNGSNNTDDVGGVSDPSIMTYCYQGKIYTRRGYPISLYNTGAPTSDVNNKWARLYDKYSCRRFLGFLGEGSTSIINTALLGDLTLEITLEGTNVLMAGCTVPDTWPIIPTTALSATGGGGMDPINDLSVDAITAADALNVLAPKVLDIQNFMKISRGFTYGNTGTGNTGNAITGTVGTNYQSTGAGTVPNAGVVAADTTIGFTLSNITFSIVRYEFADKSYTDSLNAALDRGHEFSIYFKNYQTFTGHKLCVYLFHPNH